MQPVWFNSLQAVVPPSQKNPTTPQTGRYDLKHITIPVIEHHAFDVVLHLLVQM